MAQYGVQAPAPILDLACGTGTLAIKLAQQGYQVTGIDISAAMLMQAQAKQAKTDCAPPIHWREDDMRYFLLDQPVDAVLCHYDSLNHLSNETELRGAFLQISQALKPGGLFIFDLNTQENYETFWNGQDAYEGPNYQLKTRSAFNTDTGKSEAHFSVLEYDAEGRMRRHAETVYEQYFNEHAVEKYLMAAGFERIHWHTFNPVDEIPEDFPLKSYWHCQKAN